MCNAYITDRLHKCEEAHEEVSALHANGNMRVTVLCECGKAMREYIDSVW